MHWYEISVYHRKVYYKEVWNCDSFLYANVECVQKIVRDICKGGDFNQGLCWTISWF